jgi:hypothetical protein
LGEKFGRNRYRPPGDWIQTTGLLDVVGVQHRKSDALVFARDVQTAEKKAGRMGLGFSLNLPTRTTSQSTPTVDPPADREVRHGRGHTDE